MSTPSTTTAPPNDNDVTTSPLLCSKALHLACTLSTGSWERGTAANALLEYSNPELSVFAKEPFPEGKLPRVEVRDAWALVYAVKYVRTGEEEESEGNGEGVDRGALMEDEVGVSDPCSIGIAAELIGVTYPAYATACQRQADLLLNNAPRWENGAISHRWDVNELWADNIYMAPPFLAYHAVATNDASYLHAAIEQCRLYRSVLLTKSTGKDSGLWHHIIGPTHADPGLWSTSNGWAAAGMARVLATVLHWSGSNYGKGEEWAGEVEELIEWIKEIVDGAMRTDDDEADGKTEGLLRNYLGDESWWGEVAGTALLASVVYRMAVLLPDVFAIKDESGQSGEFSESNKSKEGNYLVWADSKRKAVARHVDSENGIGAATVNPRSHLSREKMYTGSPEGQSFLVFLHAAYRQWVKAGSAGGT